MAFLTSFVGTLVKLIIFAAIGFVGILTGKKLSANKDAKKAATKEMDEQ